MMRIHRRLAALSLLLGGLIGLFLAPATAHAQELSIKGLAVKPKPSPPFFVKVDVDRKDLTYREGDSVQAVVRSEGAGHLYLFYINATGDTWCVFPNKNCANALVGANQVTNVPDLKAPAFEFVVEPPFGKEILKAYVLGQPSAVLSTAQLQQRNMTSVDAKLFGEFNRELQAASFPWGERDLQITTVPRDPEQPPDQPAGTPPPPRKRLGLFVGLSQFQASQWALPKAARTNAVQAAAIMEKECSLSTRPLILLDSEAHLKAVQHAITTELPELSRPGDDVFIYWSGRVGRSGDVEYLLPYDGDLDQRDSLILDSTFARWLQKLPHRNVTIILDTCATDGPPGGDPANSQPRFLVRELVRTKSLGDNTSAVLLSSYATKREEYAVENTPYSRMTGVLLDTLQHDQRPLTVYDTYVRIQEQKIPTNLNDEELAQKTQLRN